MMSRSEEEQFDLSKFLGDSLSIEENTIPAGRQSYRKPVEDPFHKIFLQDPLDILGERDFGEPNATTEDTLGSPIQEFYRGKCIFITGGSGFMGKVLIEKLIRSIPHIGKIYILIRPKRGKNAEERLNKLLEDRLFRRVRCVVPDWRSKLECVAGDLLEPGLGLSPADTQLLKDRVHVVFHSAADVRFEEPLKSALQANVVGTKRVLDIANQMINIQCFVYVSTAYSHCVHRRVPESIPKLSMHYNEILMSIERLNDDELNNTECFMQGWPNTYTFSKAVCENMIQEEDFAVPIIVFRPPIVLSTYREPVRGWTDNLNGPMAVFLGAGIGALHVGRLEETFNAAVAPVDFAVNCMIAAAEDTASCGILKAVKVYNFTSSPGKTTVWKTWKDLGFRSAKYWAFSKSIWYTSYFAMNNTTLFEILHLFIHRVPGFILDKVALLTGNSARLSMSNIYDRFHKLQSPLNYFSSTTWDFCNENMKVLWDSMNEEDRDLFNFSFSSYNFQEHFLVSKLGLRYYYLKDDMETLPKALSNNQRLYWAHIGLKGLVLICALKWLAWIARSLPL